MLLNQEAKDKEKRLKASGGGGGEGGAGTEELLLQIQTLTTEKAREDELRNYMQLERVNSLVLSMTACTACFSTRHAHLHGKWADPLDMQQLSRHCCDICSDMCRTSYRASGTSLRCAWKRR